MLRLPARMMIGAISLALLVMLSGVVIAQQREVGPITAAIIERGELICGGNASVAGFGFQDPVSGEFTGFDIDICRAIAAAILGDASAVTFRPLAGADRQAAIQSGEIDVMSRNTTWTLSRDVDWGVIWGPVTFYDGQGIMTRADLGVTTFAELDGSTVCVQSGTTTELNITDYITKLGLDIEILVLADANATWEAYAAGRCESWTTDKSGLAAFRFNNAENPADHVILAETLSKEPLGPLSPQSDPQFAEIVAWTVFGLIQAEEFGITSQNIDDFMTSEDPAIQRFLGLADNLSGEYLGLPNDFMVTVIRQVGNYGEIYERNLAPLGLVREGSLNALWTEGGLLYSMPFR
jgi:general L-amino acid transport system substrate-binding protein